MTSEKFTVLDAAILLILLLSLVILSLEIGRRFNKSEPVKSEPYIQKYKYVEKCPDGLFVEYVFTKRLPKGFVCQPEPKSDLK